MNNPKEETVFVVQNPTYKHRFTNQIRYKFPDLADKVKFFGNVEFLLPDEFMLNEDGIA